MCHSYRVSQNSVHQKLRKNKIKLLWGQNHIIRVWHYTLFLGAKAPLGLAHVKDNGTKKFQNF